MMTQDTGGPHVSETVTHRAIIAAARKEIRALKRPEGMQSNIWPLQKDFLLVLAGYLPDVWPSMRTLATKLDCSPMSVHRRVRTAQRFGLIATEVHPGQAMQWDGTKYHLMCLSGPLKASIVRARPVTVPCNGCAIEGRSSSSKKIGVVPPPLRGGVTPGAACGGTFDTQEATVPNGYNPDDDYPPDAIGEDPDTPLPVHRVRQIDQGTWLARYFDERWHAMARRHREWRMTKPSERGAAVKYMKGVMLAQVDFDVAEAYVQAYVNAVGDGVVAPKEGQLPFLHFTGWWGHEEIADPKERAERQAMIASAKADYHRFLEEQGLA